jgi:DNA-binding MurR/RpiR family transcriptional regulator
VRPSAPAGNPNGTRGETAAMETHLDDLRNRVRDKISVLTKGQKEVANFIIENPEKFALSSIRELEKELKTSKATIVRLTQTLGYQGFRELKFNLRDGIRQDLSPFLRYKKHLTKAPAQLNKDEPNYLKMIADETIINIHRTLRLVNENQYREAIRLIKNAGRVYTMGLGISSFLADICAYLFNLVSIKAHPLNYKGLSFAEQMVNVAEDDLILAFAFKHYSPETIEGARTAHKKKVKVISITDEATSNIVPYSVLHFQVAIESVSVSNSIMSCLTLLYAFTCSIGHDLKEKTVKLLEELETIRKKE